MPAQPTAQYQATIANAASLSGVVDLIGVNPCGIIMPAAWTAATMSFQIAPSNADGTPGTFVKLTDSAGTEISFAGAVAGGAFVFSQLLLGGIRYLKIVSGTTGSPVAQGAARTINILTQAEPG